MDFLGSKPCTPQARSPAGPPTGAYRPPPPGRPALHPPHSPPLQPQLTSSSASLRRHASWALPRRAVGPLPPTVGPSAARVSPSSLRCCADTCSCSCSSPISWSVGGRWPGAVACGHAGGGGGDGGGGGCGGRDDAVTASRSHVSCRQCSGSRGSSSNSSSSTSSPSSGGLLGSQQQQWRRWCVNGGGGGAPGGAATRGSVACAAYGRGSSPSPSDPSYYQLLGLDPDCDEEDVRVAFRRRAKELHPDVNKGDGATEAFVQLSRAYEVLSDPEARREYDMTHRIRRINFFRDIVEEEGGDRFGGSSSPFRWSRVGQRDSGRSGGGGSRRRSGGGGGGLRPEDDDDDEGDEEEEEEVGEEEEEEDYQRRRGGPSREEAEEAEEREEMLRKLAKFMSGGALRDLRSGRLDPWGTSTTDPWFQQVERQTRNPYGPHRQGYGTSQDDEDGGGSGGGGGGGREWGPSRRVPGWSPPGRGSEWSHPRRQWDEEDRRGGGGGSGGPGGPQPGGGGGDFRRPFKI